MDNRLVQKILVIFYLIRVLVYNLITMLIFKEEFMIYIKSYLVQNNINLKTPELQI